MDELIRAMQKTLLELQAANAEMERLRWQVNTASAWVAAHGEIVNKSDAARILGCSRSTLYELIETHQIKQSPDGRVLVRSMAEWASKSTRRRK